MRWSTKYYVRWGCLKIWNHIWCFLINFPLNHGLTLVRPRCTIVDIVDQKRSWAAILAPVMVGDQLWKMGHYGDGSPPIQTTGENFWNLGWSWKLGEHQVSQRLKTSLNAWAHRAKDVGTVLWHQVFRPPFGRHQISSVSAQPEEWLWMALRASRALGTKGWIWFLNWSRCFRNTGEARKHIFFLSCFCMYSTIYIYIYIWRVIMYLFFFSETCWKISFWI